jgi:hypothetical protein
VTKKRNQYLRKGRFRYFVISLFRLAAETFFLGFFSGLVLPAPTSPNMETPPTMSRIVSGLSLNVMIGGESGFFVFLGAMG